MCCRRSFVCLVWAQQILSLVNTLLLFHPSQFFFPPKLLWRSCHILLHACLACSFSRKERKRTEASALGWVLTVLLKGLYYCPHFTDEDFQSQRSCGSAKFIHLVGGRTAILNKVCLTLEFAVTVHQIISIIPSSLFSLLFPYSIYFTAKYLSPFTKYSLSQRENVCNIVQYLIVKLLLFSC